MSITCEPRPDPVRVRHDVEREPLRRQPRKDRAVGDVDRAGRAQAAGDVARELAAALGDDRQRAAVVEARTVAGTDRLQRQAAELTEEAQQHPLVRRLRALFVGRLTIADLETVGLAAMEHAVFLWARAVLVVDAQDREA